MALAFCFSGHGRLLLLRLLGFTGKTRKIVIKLQQLKYRGAIDNENEKKRLNDQGGKLLRDAGIDFAVGRDYDWITKDFGCPGYAEYYLSECENESTMINEADASIYRQLVEIDTALGTTSISINEQKCAHNSTF